MGRPQTISLSESRPASGAVVLARRCADVVIAALALIVLAPLLATLALLVRLTSHGPVLHRESSLSPSGRPVNLLVFRTLVDGGATVAHERLRAAIGAGEAYSPVGRQIARLRLDRLPRLINVLRGDSTLLG
jgi:putative colanic acid biosysnthesis UDP-glucose lipid carrier transferase